MRLQIGDHLAECGAAGLLGGLYVHIFPCHCETVGGGIILQEFQLGWDREALPLLLLRGDASIDDGLAAGGLGGMCGLRCFYHLFRLT